MKKGASAGRPVRPSSGRTEPRLGLSCGPTGTSRVLPNFVFRIVRIDLLKSTSATSQVCRLAQAQAGPIEHQNHRADRRWFQAHALRMGR